MASSCELTDTLWTATSRISSLINGTQPVYRLPPEILVEVFGWYKLGSAKRNKWFTLVRFTSVSRTWRSTILSFPPLWSVAYLSGNLPPETIRMLLQKSGAYPLDVIVPPTGLSTPKFNRYSHALDASAHTPRIRRLRLYREAGGDDMKHLTRIFSSAAPNLTHLELLGFRSEDEVIPFPNLFGLVFPKLRVLKVAGVGAWPEIVGANLTHITIHVSPNPRLLNNCIPYSPNLKVLKICGVCDPEGPRIGARQIITLPPGTCLSIQDSRECPRVLTLFALPWDGHIKIRLSMNSQPNMPLFYYVLPLEISLLQNLRTLTRLHIKAHFDARIARVALELKCFRLDQLAFEANIRYPFEGPVGFRQDASPVVGLLDGLHQLALEGVEELRMEGIVGRFSPRGDELPIFLKRMPALTRLITTDGNEETLRSALDGLGCQAVVVRMEE